MLMDKLQDSNYRRLIFSGRTTFIKKIHQFDLDPHEAYVTTHF